MPLPFDTLVIASKNKGKSSEIKRMLQDSGINLKVLDYNDIPFEDVEETGTTFAENAILKAEAGAQSTGHAVIADDSGICVDALDGRPGVQTARYSQDPQRLLDEMANVPFERRTAQFNCTLALKIPHHESVLFEGVVKGFILTEKRGEHGFAYDPVFLPEGEQQCFGEMLPVQKAAISHRGRALRKFIQYLKDNV